MRFAGPHSWTAALLALFCLSLTPSAKADTFSIGIVGNSNSGYFVAADDFGDYSVRLYSTSVCHTSGDTCFENYNASTHQTTYSTQQESMRNDPSPIAGTGCTLSLAGGVSLCTNGHQVLGGFYEGVLGVWAQDSGTLQRIWDGTLDGPSILTANGNIFFEDGLHENLIVGLASPSATVATPEPSSLCLLATGVLGVFGAARRKYLA